ncbi:MAG: hypothetical protein ACREEB_09385 [Caulobacteraceae bacterium]
MKSLFIAAASAALAFPVWAQTRSKAVPCGQSNGEGAVDACATPIQSRGESSAIGSDKHRLTSHLTVFPSGARIPGSLLDQAKDSDLGGHSACFADWDDNCDVYVLDLFGDGAVAVLMAATDEQDDHYLPMEIFQRRPDGKWAKSGELVVTCAESIKALRMGEFSFAPPRARDVVLAGRQFNILADPEYACPELGGKSAKPPW